MFHIIVQANINDMKVMKVLLKYRTVSSANLIVLACLKQVWKSLKHIVDNKGPTINP